MLDRLSSFDLWVVSQYVDPFGRFQGSDLCTGYGNDPSSVRNNSERLACNEFFRVFRCCFCPHYLVTVLGVVNRGCHAIFFVFLVYSQYLSDPFVAFNASVHSHMRLIHTHTSF